MKKNVYLDCGGHYGEGLREFINMYNINNDWIIETFEPNPECKFREKISDITLNNLIIHEKAVWIYDGYINFSQENHKKSKSNSPNDGTSDIDGWGSVITELDSTHLKFSNSPIQVACVDFHTILKKYPKENFNIIVKLDIEGAEYKVLRHIISMGSFININTIYVEWHHVDFNYENNETTLEIIKILKNQGIKILNWK